MGEVVWTRSGEKSDDLGMTHVYYQQAFRPSSALAAALEETYVLNGVELAGGELGVHAAATGVHSIFGAQHREVQIPVLPAVARTLDAFEIAQNALALRPGFQAADWRLWPADVIAALRARTRPLLATTGVPGRFRLVWEVPTFDANGAAHVVTLDGTDGTIIELAGRTIPDTCIHQGTTHAVGIGHPEHNLGQPNRSIGATVGNAVPPYTHEAAWLQPGTGIPPIKVYIGLKGLDDNFFSTLDCPGKRYGVFPVQPGRAGRAVYATHDFMGSPLCGGVAADAMYYTYLTMQTFHDDFGWDGWDGNGTEARVVVNADHYTLYDTAAWNDALDQDVQYPFFNPGKSVSIYRTYALPWHASAAIDSVAHEWGHAMAFNPGHAAWAYRRAVRLTSAVSSTRGSPTSSVTTSSASTSRRGPSVASATSSRTGSSWRMRPASPNGGWTSTTILRCIGFTARTPPHGQLIARTRSFRSARSRIRSGTSWRSSTGCWPTGAATLLVGPHPERQGCDRPGVARDRCVACCHVVLPLRRVLRSPQQ